MRVSKKAVVVEAGDLDGGASVNIDVDFVDHSRFGTGLFGDRVIRDIGSVALD